MSNKFLIVGLNQFNRELAYILEKSGSAVAVVGTDNNTVSSCIYDFEQLIMCNVADYRDVQTNLSFSGTEQVIVGTDCDVESSITICSNLFAVGAQHIITQCIDENHKRILTKMGVEVLDSYKLDPKQLALKLQYKVDVETIAMFDDEVIVHFVLQKDLKVQDLSKAPLLQLLQLKKVNKEIINDLKPDQALKKGDVLSIFLKKENIEKIKKAL